MTSSTPHDSPPAPRAIRFVTNHDGPYAKRRRINSACLTCRRKKTRCSGERPVCSTCTANKHECAGYGDDNQPADASKDKDGKRAAQRESKASSSMPTLRVKVEPTAQASIPSIRHTAYFDPDSSNHNEGRTSRHHGDSGHTRSATRDTGTLSLQTRNRMPYFRYFGPTAIMPGFKQMVVKIRGQQHSAGHTASDPLESSSSLAHSAGSPSEAPTPAEIPIYDNSAMSPSPLITHLCSLFFVHLGCNFPFLQQKRFMRDLEDKQVDAILVDAVCALAARFSTHPSLVNSDTRNDGENESLGLHASERGQAFAQRAKSAIPDAFPCPSVAVVQAALLLAYDEFGASRDSGLWMYLGIAIRMAQDLGMQTLEGLRYEGRNGPTPTSVQTVPQGQSGPSQSPLELPRLSSGDAAEEEQRAVERERLDTFWSIFFLDRVISSGTGRPVTLRDQDIEISFPSLEEVDSESGWSLPFPALIRIIHLYGRVTDLLNSIKEKAHITDQVRRQLDTLEYHLTEIYQNLSPKLHFNAVNFQHYVKIDQGTNFLLLHCWFHTLIVLLHQPTLLKTFEGSIQPLSSNSRELSMSSAKTVADILAFTELIDAKTGVGNPFTSQPIYIAACAFLQETALHSASSQPHSRPSSPRPQREPDSTTSGKTSLDHMTFEKSSVETTNERTHPPQDHDQKQAAKHTLLASAANQNYQRCFRAIKSLETYWAGVKYILTVLDQKSKGVGDPLLYTREEMESALEAPSPEPSFTSPGWRRRLSRGAYLTTQDLTVSGAKVPAAIRNKGARTPTISGSPMPHPSHAIGWSLTGTMNSPSTNVAVMYTSENGLAREAKPSHATPQSVDSTPSIASIMTNPSPRFDTTQSLTSPSSFSPFDPTSMPPPPGSSTFNPVPTPDPVLVSHADLLLSLHSPFPTASPNTTHPGLLHNHTSFARDSISSTISTTMPNHIPAPSNDFSPTFATYSTPSDFVFGDIAIDSQDVDMSLLGAEMLPWDLEYLPHNLYFGDAPFGVGDVNDEGVGAPD